jgi:hypothetical protein
MTADSLISEFRYLSEAELERRFCGPAAAPVLAPGDYTGTWLRRIENAGTYKPLNFLSQYLLFELTPFGISFRGDGSGTWYFFEPRFAAGEFTTSKSQSRWRDTDCLALDYSQARLPGFIRDLLYDEIKVLSTQHAIGIGGFNQPAGEGDNFYFLLTRKD